MIIRRTLLSALIAATLAGAAQAQIAPGEAGVPQGTPEQPNPEADKIPLPPQDAPRTQAPAEEQADAAAAENASRAADMIGVNIETPKGETIGQIQNVVVDGSTGEATHVVIAHGVARDDMKLAAVPWDTVQGMKHGGVIVMERARLEGAPSFTPAAPPDLSDPAWSAPADRYWNSARNASADQEKDRA